MRVDLYIGAALVLVALKLAGIVTWGWLWVTAPLWVPMAGAVAFLLAVLLSAVVIG